MCAITDLYSMNCKDKSQLVIDRATFFAQFIINLQSHPELQEAPNTFATAPAIRSIISELQFQDRLFR